MKTIKIGSEGQTTKTVVTFPGEGENAVTHLHVKDVVRIFVIHCLFLKHSLHFCKCVLQNPFLKNNNI